MLNHSAYLREIVEHLDGLPGEGEVGAALPLVLRQRPQPPLLLLLKGARMKG